LKTNETKQQFQANKKAKRQKEANTAKGRFLGMMAAATAGCCSGQGDGVEAKNDDVEMITELVVDGNADNLPDHLLEEDYNVFIDCQAGSVNT
jgi:hypothetical protein